ncbi:hypothetical protein HYT04_01505 [Candidatus Kaiserbacteria bacterium]|nr:hypothetical protein [Candidatus Kaiserbacteria bacterium]
MYMFDIPVGKASAEVNVWSPCDAWRYGFPSWSLRPIQTQDDVLKRHALANGVRAAFGSIGVRTAYAPNVSAMSAVVAHQEAIRKNKIQLGEAAMYRNSECPADGVFLYKDEAFVMSAAGCPLIIATAGEHMIVAHAGRDSLVERNAVLGKPARQHVSIVYALIEEFLKKGAPLNEIVMCMMFSVPTELFNHHPMHPEYGAYNRALIKLVDTLWDGSTVRKNDNVFLDMESLFVNQARDAGIRRAWATHSLREFPSLAHMSDGKDPSRRNLFVVKRNA